MKKIKRILNEYWIAYAVDALIFALLHCKETNLLLFVSGQIVNWIILTVVLVFLNRNNGGGFAT